MIEKVERKRGHHTNKDVVRVCTCVSMCVCSCVCVGVCDICISGSEAAPVMDGPHLYVHTE